MDKTGVHEKFLLVDLCRHPRRGRRTNSSDIRRPRTTPTNHALEVLLCFGATTAVTWVLI